MVAYYIIPMVTGPYTKESPNRPQYVDEIRCNWTGHNVDSLGVFICKVNTTEEKHTDLAGRSGVRQLPRNYTWETVISTMPPAARNIISNWCNNKDIPFDSTETIGSFLQRVICQGVFTIGKTALATPFQDLTQDQKDKITSLCQKWGITYQTTDTIKQLATRCGPIFWDGPSLNVREF